MSEEAPAPEPGTLPAHWTGLRNPFFLAFVVGIVAVTASRMIFINEPLPPPVGRALPTFSAADQHGKPFGTDELEGRVWVGVVLQGEGRALTALSELQAAFERVHEPVTLVGIWMGPEPGTAAQGAPDSLRALGLAAGLESGRTKLVELTSPAASEFVTAAFSEHRASVALESLLSEPMFVLVDGQGHGRGVYPITAEGVDEVYHRARRVVDTE